MPAKRPFHHGDLRNALIKAVKALIEREGMEAFALREAAGIVGVSANAAYNHFEDKDALLRAVASSGSPSWPRKGKRRDRRPLRTHGAN